MGRARITLKHISNERSRKKTFMQRSKVLVKKASEFSTLCGVEACLIVYDDGNGDVEPLTCPKDPALAHSILQKYESQKNERPPKKFGIQDFVKDRKSIVEAKISKVHKEIPDIKYPTWNPSFRNMEEEQLRAFVALVDAKIRACDHTLKNMHQSEGHFMQNMARGSASSSHPTPMEPLNNNGGVDVTNSINQVYEACNHGLYMQQVDAPFSYIPDVVQESANCLQNISQSQPILEEALKTLNVENEMVGFSNRVDVPLDTTNQLGDLLDWFDGPIDWYDHLGWTSQPNESILLQNIEVQSQNEQQGGAALKTLNVENEMVGFSNRDYVPLDTTNQLGDFLDWFDGPIDWYDHLGWSSQPNESILQNIEVQSQNEQQGGAALKTLNVENEMVGFSNRDYVPLDTTNQLGDFLDWFDGPIDDCSDLVCWTSQR